MGLKIAKIYDLSLIKKTKEATKKIIEKDADLSSFHLLRGKLQKYTIQNISPD